MGQGIYFIAKDGTYYRLTTFAAGGLFPIDLWLQWGLLLFGACLAVVAGRALRDDREWIPAVFGGLGAGYLVIIALEIEPYGGLGLLAAVLVGVAALLVTIGYEFRRRVAAGMAALFVAALFVGLINQGWAPTLPLALAVLLSLFVGLEMILKHVQPIRRLRGAPR